jgi:hypothetical protein
VPGVVASALASEDSKAGEAPRAIGDCSLEVCQGNVDSAKSCFGKANDCMDLECKPESTAPTTNIFKWYMSPYGSNRYLGNLFESFDKNYEVSFSIPKNVLYLQIKSLKGLDAGRNMFSAVQLYTNKTCYFNVFVYDPVNYTASLTIGSSGTYQLNATRNVTVPIDSFKTDTAISYTYKYEALPLGSLFVNNVNMSVRQCTSSTAYPWLTCLETNSASIPLTRCLDSYTLGFSYGYDDQDKQLASKVNQRNFSTTINLICKYDFLIFYINENGVFLVFIFD